MKILFVVKATSEYGGCVMPSKSGLRNSARFVVDAIDQLSDVVAVLEIVRDGNAIDKHLHHFRPDVCVIEAIWVTPAKLRELITKYPAIRFVVRVHSKTPFLAMEGMAIEWLKEYSRDAIISFNHADTGAEFERLGIRNVFLPNIYPMVVHRPFKEVHKKHHYYKIGCFGAIRPFKNHLAQAMAAIQFAEKQRAAVHFFINYSRVEQKGESILKNLRALFAGTRHKLVEIEWLDHLDFIKLLAGMDACMQVSFTETFNIVTADSIHAHVPVVVSKEIDWLTCRKANAGSESDIAKVLEYVIENKRDLVEDNIHDLNEYNQHAVLKWFRFINRY